MSLEREAPRIAFKVMDWWECWAWKFADCTVIHYGVPGSPSESYMIVEWF